MKKQLLKSAFSAIVGVGLLAGTSWALPTLDAGFSWNDSDYWTVTDLSKGNAAFELRWENPSASLESSFGIYAYGDSTNMLEIFSAASEPSIYQSIYFTLVGSTWYVSLDSNVVGQAFTTSFGFYGEVSNGNIFYTDVQYNQDGVEHFVIAFQDPNIAKIYFEDIYGRDITTTTDSEDYEVVTTDIQPIPEPTTMALFGAGLMGLAAVARRKK